MPTLCASSSMHGGCVWGQVVRETLPALQKLKQEGLVRHIGINCYPLKPYQYILDRWTPPGVMASPC